MVNNLSDVARNSVSILFQKHRPVESIDQSQVSGNIEDQSQVSGILKRGVGRKSVNRIEPDGFGPTILALLFLYEMIKRTETRM